MPLLEGQWSVRDLVLGPGTIYRLMDDSNPLTRTIRADQASRRAWGRGSWSGAEWTDEAVVPIRVLVDTDDQAAWLAAHQQLAAAFAPVEDTPSDVELRFAFAGAEYVMFGRPRMVEPELSLVADGRGFTRCAFVALDPLIYSGVQHSEVLVLPTTSGGLTAPVTAPVTVAATIVSGRRTLTNAGTAPAGLVLRIDGPVVEPRVSLLAGGGTLTLRFALTLDSAQWLDVDTAARTVYLNGTASRRGQASGDWPILPPGDGEIAFDAAVYNASAGLSVTWRDAWF